VPGEQLPVLLPEMEDFSPDGGGRSPLARLPDFVNTACPNCNGPAQRETDTMGGFACSSWYFLRFTSPHYDLGPFDPQAMRAWMPVDLYVGGAEHAVLHLLYARFWTQVLTDAGLVPFREPFTRLSNQGQLLAQDRRRMSKSRGNVITPDEIVGDYGADALRVYILFMAPFEQDVDWSEQGIQGARRFLNRWWDLYSRVFSENYQASGEDRQLERLLHKTIRRVGERTEAFRFNTAISALMEAFNALMERYRQDTWRTETFYQALETMLVLLAPFAPHIAEELWRLAGHTDSIHLQPWPAHDDTLAQDAWLQIPVQVDGKLRAVVEAPSEAGEAEVREAAFAAPKVRQHLVGRTVVKDFYVPGKVFSIVSRAEASPGERR
jgi:leucyl-tRNA synthetase